jgi:hypothetical protein
VRRFFQRARWDDERRREIEAHIELLVDDLVERGMSREAARQQALREFGNRAVIKEEISATPSACCGRRPVSR